MMKHRIIIVAPYPKMQFVSEGWMSRIKAVDRIFETTSRAYVNFGEHHRKDIDGHAVDCGGDVAQYNLNINEPSHQVIFDQLLHHAEFVYVHTVHLAINVQRWLQTGKIIVDVHGIVPEEEIMLGRPDEAARFTPVEKDVLEYCKNIVVVTHSMKRHLLDKYPESTAHFIILPIFEQYFRQRKIVQSDTNDKLKVVYAGGTQVWQNIDQMFELVKVAHEYINFTFISHDKDFLITKAQSLGLEGKLTIRSAQKEELPAIYAEQDFGLVLRDETAVNIVSCPTKLSEYLDFGIIPIVKYSGLGDFEEFGYSYITEDDVKSMMIPDAVCRNNMIQNNYNTIQTLINEFKTGSSKLLSLIQD